MNQLELETALRDLTLGGLRFFPSTGSTNDEALAWAAGDAPDLALVVADEQTTGRGRDGRKWFTPAGEALAFSLILHPDEAEREHVGRFAGLGALALCGALKKHGLVAGIKWPNDVLVNRKKAAGLLVEAVWTGAEVDGLVLGMGVNVGPGSLPPENELTFPATSLENEGGGKIERVELLKEILQELIALRATMLTDEFMQAWQEALVFRGERVMIWQGGAQGYSAQLVGLEGDGSLVVSTDEGERRVINFGEVHLRPA